MVVAVVLGVAFGGVRVLAKIFFPGKVFDRPEQMDVLQLGLSGKTINCFSVATNPSILLFARYFRFSSEQYPLSVRTSSGFCPDCSWIALISGTTCCLSLVACVTVCPTINWKTGSTATCVL